MKLWELLTEIQRNKRKRTRLSANSNGKLFEEAIKELLINDGSYGTYPSNSFKKHANFAKAKKLLSDKTNPDLIIKRDWFNNICGVAPIIIYQPFGSQMFPDFLLIKKDYLIPFEIKFSTTDGETPTWNSNLPHNCGIYIFGSRGKQDITFFNGADYLTAEEKALMVSLVNEMTKKLKQEGLLITHKFDIYLREMYNQKFSTLNHSKRTELENKAIELLKKIEEINN